MLQFMGSQRVRHEWHLNSKQNSRTWAKPLTEPWLCTVGRTGTCCVPTPGQALCSVQFASAVSPLSSEVW